jgi:chromate transporter
LLVWLKVGCLGFGGPAGQIALLHRTVVEETAWIDEARFAHALSFCMLLPGPEAQQLAVWLGWRLHGIRGGVAAGLLFVLPGLLVMLGLSALYVAHGRSEWAGPVLLGLKAAVVALVAQALVRIGRRAVRDRAGLTAAIVAFALLTFTTLPFPLLILAAGLAGWLLGGGVVAESEPSRGRGQGRIQDRPGLSGAVARAGGDGLDHRAGLDDRADGGGVQRPGGGQFRRRLCGPGLSGPGGLERSGG